MLPFSAASRLFSCDKALPALRFFGAWLLLWQGQWIAREVILQREDGHSPRQASRNSKRTIPADAIVRRATIPATPRDMDHVTFAHDLIRMKANPGRPDVNVGRMAGISAVPTTPLKLAIWLPRKQQLQNDSQAVAAV